MSLDVQQIAFTRSTQGPPSLWLRTVAELDFSESCGQTDRVVTCGHTQAVVVYTVQLVHSVDARKLNWTHTRKDWNRNSWNVNFLIYDILGIVRGKLSVLRERIIEICQLTRIFYEVFKSKFEFCYTKIQLWKPFIGVPQFVSPRMIWHL